MPPSHLHTAHPSLSSLICIPQQYPLHTCTSSHTHLHSTCTPSHMHIFTHAHPHVTLYILLYPNTHTLTPHTSSHLTYPPTLTGQANKHTCPPCSCGRIILCRGTYTFHCLPIRHIQMGQVVVTTIYGYSATHVPSSYHYQLKCSNSLCV